MRTSTLLLLSFALACGEAAVAGPPVIERFLARASPLSCDPVDLGVDAAATEIRLASDSTWTLLDGPQLQLLSFTDRFRLVARTPLPGTGPGAAAHPVSAALLGDSAVVVAARGSLRLVVLSPDGKLLRAIPLDFIPNSVEISEPGGILVTPLPFGTRPPTLLMRHTSAGWEPLPVPKRVYEDMSVNALGNAALVELFPDRRVLVMHQFLSPRAFIVDTNDRVEPRTAPTPDATREHIDFVPRSPLTPEQMVRMLVPAMAMTIDPRRSELYVLTRSGGEVGGRPERAILRLSDRLEFLQGYTLPVVAGSMVYLPRRHSVLVVDDADRFHLCTLSGTGTGHDPAP